jgi:uridylate kinase
MSASTPKYRRILSKVSGEALMGDGACGIDSAVIGRLAGEVRDLTATGIQVALVIGGGNIFRGVGLVRDGIDRVTGDHMGMLATVMNSLAIQDTLERLGAPARVMSALKIDQVCEPYDRRRALRHLEQGRVVIFAAGTGNPLFTTDSAASLRAVEIGADLLIKATKVDGVFSSDPLKDAEAVFYKRLTYNQALRENLGVMDATAMVLCRDNGLPTRVMNIYKTGALMLLIGGGEIGSLVEPGE